MGWKPLAALVAGALVLTVALTVILANFSQPPIIMTP